MRMVDYFIPTVNADPYSSGAETRAEFIREFQTPGGLRRGIEHFDLFFDNPFAVAEYTNRNRAKPVLGISRQLRATNSVGNALNAISTAGRSLVTENVCHWITHEALYELSEVFRDFVGENE